VSARIESAVPLVAPARVSLTSALASSRIAGLDFLRAVAVLLVIADHSGLHKIGPLAVFDGGFGVEIFFVLSGFLITTLLYDDFDRSGSVHLGTFYRNRAARLLPAFYAYLIVGALLLIGLHRAVPWGAVASSAFYVINYYQAFTGADAHYLSHCWSLAVEEQFYLLWPLLLIFVLRRRIDVVRGLAGFIAAIWLLRALLATVFGASDEYLYRALETRADQLAIGCLLAVMLRDPAWRRRLDAFAARGWIAIVIIVLMVASLTFLHGGITEKYAFAYALEPFLVALLIPLTIVAASGGGVMARLLNLPLAVMIGQVSYGIYLFHPWIINPFRHVFERVTGSFGVSVILSIAVLVAVAYASFKYFESPARRRIRGDRKPASVNG
jgi:peptidoglycan/LPS O-acetylase OafA/YrhL